MSNQKVTSYDLFEEMSNLLGSPFVSSSKPAGYKPKYDIVSLEDTTKVIMEIPGVTKSDVSVKTEDNLLIISGTKNKIDIGYDFVADNNSLAYGKFQHNFQLSADDDASSINAIMKHGVLVVTVDKDKVQQPKSVNININ